MNWLMLTLVGKDQSGIVSQVTDALFEGGCTLGETSMIRLGGNFTIMMMVDGGHDAQSLAGMIDPVADRLQLKCHVDPVPGGLHQHRVPNFQVSVNGADQAGIVAKVTGALAKCGFNILELASDVVGDAEEPVYIMTIQGYAATEIETLKSALDPLAQEGIDVHISSVETLIG
jgi:glycine cleavage system transcriptional repressor